MNGTISKKTELPERDKKASTYRRVVTENVTGTSVVQSDEQMKAIGLRLFPATCTPSPGSTRLRRISADSKGLTGIPPPSFRDLAARVC